MPDIVYQHKDVLPEGRHRPFNYEFNTEADRLAFIPGAESKGSIALVKATSAIYILTNTSPITWDKLLTREECISLINTETNYTQVFPDSHRHTPGLTIPQYPIELPPIGPAGGCLIDYYPNPQMKPTGVIAGTYTAPTITINVEGRIEQVIDSNNVALLNGSIFTGPITTKAITTKEELTIENILKYKPYISSGAGWIPKAADGVLQIRTLTGDGHLSDITDASPGMVFKLVIIQDTVGNRQLTFSSQYKFNEVNRLIGQEPSVISMIDLLVVDANTYICQLNIYT